MRHSSLCLLTLSALLLVLLTACGSSSNDGHDTAVDGDADSRLDGDSDADSDGDAASQNTFPPETQTAFLEKGLILPRNSLSCTPVSTGVPQTTCNHHASSIEELPDGSLGVVWYTGEQEKSLDSRLVWARKPVGTTTWNAPVTLYDDPVHSEGNPTLYADEKGTYYVFEATIVGDGWDQAEIRMLTSTDAGTTWSAATVLESSDHHFNIRHRPHALANGDWLLPLYNESFAIPVFLRSTDRFATWTIDAQLPDDGTYLTEHPGQIQPALADLGGGHLVVLTRDGLATQRIKRMESTDWGKNWTQSKPTELPNAGTGIDQVRLLDGHTVAIFNNSPSARFPLNAALSLDEGKTFVAMRTLHDDNTDCNAPGSCSYHYPSVIQSTRDGSIWVSYTHNRETIGWVHFNEAWLMQGKETLDVYCVDSNKCVSGACVHPCLDDGSCTQGRTCLQNGCRDACTSNDDCGIGDSCQSGHCLPDATRLPYKCEK